MTIAATARMMVSITLISTLVICFPNNVSFAETNNTADSSAPKAVKAKSIKLDAKRLIFAKKGNKLKLIPTVKPTKANTANIIFKSSNTKIAVVDSNGVVRAKGWGECTITAKIDSVKAVCKVSVAKKWAAITFDDGPGKPTQRLLRGLKKQKVQATFFIVGSMAKSRKGTLKKIHKDGHEIANHTYNHKAAARTLKSQLSKTDKLIKSVTGKKAKLMRPPGGAINSTTKKCRKAVIMWSVDPKDWKNRNARTVEKRVMSKVKSGSIILLHDIHPTSVTAALRITKKMKAKGYTFVTVSDLIGNPKINKVYRKGRSKVKTMKIK